ncbi:MAG: sigma 54-interacting transcriptional regulator [Firmicutes bacterium]|nr:sigma 54-interacting transcriptional regulator [Bacillota bacterium]MBR4023650.1 sigma 54-interacting transcriptional regulator [Bacillota bacterium]
MRNQIDPITRIDFKEIIENIDESVLITDGEGRVIYVNPAYPVNTGIPENQVMGKTITQIIEEGNIFKGGAVNAVLETKKKAYRLSDVVYDGKHEIGYVIGVPLFDEDGNIKQIIAQSRPIKTLKMLQADYSRFMREANKPNDSQHVVLDEFREESLRQSRLIGKSKAIREIWTTITGVAPTTASVLITGESGCGKEIVADEIYVMSERKNKPFVKVNCASIPMNLLESELFGYEKGAFSGASSSGKKGLFEVANTGTLLLDEIGDMPLDLQAKLLRAIQSKEITRVGGTKKISLDIRILASTNVNLKEKIKEGSFRQDLFYRLNVIPIHIPPLRERPEDIPLLCEHFISLFHEKHGNELILTNQHYDILQSYSWPGNVRELENVIEYLTIFSKGVSGVDTSTLRGILDMQEETPAFVSHGGTLDEQVAAFEKAIIEDVLKNSTSLRDAGAKLGVNASTISRKIKLYNIEY